MPKLLKNRKTKTQARTEYEKLADESDRLVAQAATLLDKAKALRDQAEALPIGDAE